MTHSEKQGWIRTILTIGSVVVSVTGAIYYLKAEVESHINNKEIHLSYSQISKDFVSRSEYESGFKRIEDDLKYVRGRLDTIAELIMQKRRDDARDRISMIVSANDDDEYAQKKRTPDKYYVEFKENSRSEKL